MLEWLGTVSAVLVGGAITLGAEWFRSTRARADSRNDRQVAILAELHPAILEWQAATAKSHMITAKQLVQDGRTSHIDEELDAEEMHSGRRVRYLVEQVKDEAVRDSVRRVLEASNEIDQAILREFMLQEPLTASWIYERSIDVGNAYIVAVEKIGDAIRRLS